MTFYFDLTIIVEEHFWFCAFEVCLQVFGENLSFLKEKAVLNKYK